MAQRDATEEEVRQLSKVTRHQEGVIEELSATALAKAAEGLRARLADREARLRDASAEAVRAGAERDALEELRGDLSVV